VSKVIRKQKCYLLVDRDAKPFSVKKTPVFLELDDIANYLDVPRERVLQASSKGYKIKRRYLVLATDLMVPAGFRKTHIVPKAATSKEKLSFSELIRRKI
jgi:hypothetical protein